MTKAQNLVPTPLAAELYSLIKTGWSAETSSDENWSPDCPEAGQCAVTALIVQDILGGVLSRAIVNGTSHYWNGLDDGTVIDFTRSQFDMPLTIEDQTTRQRSYVLGFPETAARYERLREQVQRLYPSYKTEKVA